jgi:hypothetical protein
MDYTIEQVLGTQYAMFYHPAIAVDDLTPVCTLTQSISVVNDELAHNGRDLSKWSAAHQDEAARLLWVNWMYHRLGTEPIRKPILTHEDNQKLIVDCGDTRLMSLSLLIDPGTVGVVVTVPVARAEHYADWRRINTNRDLMRATGFGRGASIAVRPAPADYAIEWLEIGDHTTAHHLHDVDQRVSMLQQYLNSMPDDFVFSTHWASTQIDWDSYAK